MSGRVVNVTAILFLVLCLGTTSACTEEQDGECGSGAACTAGWSCFEGECRKLCITHANCAKDQTCARGVCWAVENPTCHTDPDCDTPPVCHIILEAACSEGACHYPNAEDGLPCVRSGGDGDPDGYCAAGICLPSEATCLTNDTCAPGTCIAGSCAVPSGVGGVCDGSPDDDGDCTGDLVCINCTCRIADGDACTDNTDCVNTCIDSLCTPPATQGQSCDTNDDDDCATEFVCINDTCTPASSCLGGNLDCTDPTESCIDGVCRALGVTGSLCDTEPDDDDDCTSGNVCLVGICLLDNNQPCANNSQCVYGCIALVCRDLSDTLGECDDNENADCAANHTCVGTTCLLQNGQSCTDNTDCVNSCIDGSCSDRSGVGDPCDISDDSDCVSALLCDGGVCRIDDGDDCAANDDCVNTCIGGVCADFSLDDGSCDLDDDADCISGLHCRSNGTCGAGSGCVSNTACTETGESCIDGVCRALAVTGGVCDAPDDHGDCISGNVCIDGICLRPDDESCTVNNQCANVCIDDSCAPMAVTGETCDETLDCVTGHTCRLTCLLNDGQTGCTVNEDCDNVCIVDTCAPQSTPSGPCDETADCLAGDCVGELCLAGGLRIFVTNGTILGSAGGLTEMDAFCASDNGNPDGAATWAALIGHTGSRDVSINWVLLPNTTYFRADGTTPIATTDTNGWFTFTLDNSIGTGGSGLVWSGLASDGTCDQSELNTCTNWTEPLETGRHGDSRLTTSSAFSLDTSPCTDSLYLYCAEQP